MEVNISWKNYLGTGKEYRTKAYSLDEDTISNVVPNNKPHGNYKIL